MCLSKTYLNLTGWKLDGNPPKEVFEKCVMICAPHTTNWDFPITLAIMNSLGVEARYATKKELLVFPFRRLLINMGCIPIDRKPKKKGEKRQSTVDAIAELFDQHEKLCLLIAAEGTRSRRTEWKTGFYYIALKANVPICLGYLDYPSKTGGIGKVIYPTGDIQADMKKIMDFFKDKKGYRPEKFSLDQRFFPPQKDKPEKPETSEK